MLSVACFAFLFVSVIAQDDFPIYPNSYSDIVNIPNPLPRDPVPRTFEIKFLYILPRSTPPRYNIENTLKSLIQSLKDFYTLHLGKTFKTTDPAFEVIHSPYTEEEIKNGTYNKNIRYIYPDGSPDFWANTWENMVDIIYDESKPYFYQRNSQRVNFFTITDINAWVALGGSGMVSVGGQELGRYISNQRWNFLKSDIYPLGSKIHYHPFSLFH